MLERSFSLVMLVLLFLWVLCQSSRRKQKGHEEKVAMVLVNRFAGCNQKQLVEQGTLHAVTSHTMEIARFVLGEDEKHYFSTRLEKLARWPWQYACVMLTYLLRIVKVKKLC